MLYQSSSVTSLRYPLCQFYYVMLLLRPLLCHTLQQSSFSPPPLSHHFCFVTSFTPSSILYTRTFIKSLFLSTPYFVMSRDTNPPSPQQVFFLLLSLLLGAVLEVNTQVVTRRRNFPGERRLGSINYGQYRFGKRGYQRKQNPSKLCIFL